MNDDHSQIMPKADQLQQILPGFPEPGRIISPLGWSIKIRLICAGAASALLWLAVAWAMGWLS
jgi:hypothetical protein